MSSLIEKLDLFSTEQISDIEMLVDIYEQIPNEKKRIVSYGVSCVYGRIQRRLGMSVIL